MIHDTPNPCRSEARLAIPFEALDALLRHEAEEHDLTLRPGPDGGIWAEVEGGTLGLRHDGGMAVLSVRAPDPDWLHAICESVDEHLAHHAPGTPAPVWTGPRPAGHLPPNFSLARVARVERLTADFLRVRLEGRDLARLDRDMIHFRFALPRADGQPTVWPRLNAAGRTEWPDKLHRPAYTISGIDADAGWLETDVFIHPGGRVCGFLDAARPGAQVGLTGPGGGGIPRGEALAIGGDETAYPALARIIAAQAPTARIAAHLFGARADYPFPTHPGLAITHRPHAEASVAAEIAAAPPVDQYWFATKKARLKPLKRAILDTLAVPKTRTHLAAYWNAAEPSDD